MIARRLAVVLAVAAAACAQHPAGQCDADSQCLAGEICTSGVCIRLVTDHLIGSTCARDSDCVAWGVCDANVCTLPYGRCDTDANCAGWESCDTATHYCVLAPNGCSNDAACALWQDCVGYRCQTAAGRCAVAADCAAWQVCGADHYCSTGSGYCATAADCQPWQTCGASHVCTDVSLDPARVEATGGLAGSSLGVYAFAPVDAPGAARYDTTASLLHAAVHPSGWLVYAVASGGGTQVRKLAPDPLVWDGSSSRWTAAASPLSNDTVLAASGLGCTSIGEFVLQAGSGALLYECADAVAGMIWLDETGAQRASGYRVVAWTAAGVMLGTVDTTQLVPAHVVDALGVSTPVTGLPAGSIQAARVAGTGFRVALVLSSDPTLPESWLIGTDGVSTLEGTFAAAPAGTTPSTAWTQGALDGSGNLLQLDPGSGAVVKRPLAPGASTTVYARTVPAGANDATKTPFVPYLTTDAGTRLFGGP